MLYLFGQLRISIDLSVWYTIVGGIAKKMCGMHENLHRLHLYHYTISE